MEKRISLNGKWHFKEIGTDVWYEGQVPGCVQLDLIKLGKLQDPYYRMNEIEFHKLEDKEWVYKKEFTLSTEHLNEYDAVKLVFEGVDTFADVYLNGVYLGKTQNMFIPYEFDIKGVIREGINILEVYFKSITKTVKLMEKVSPVKLEWSGDSGRPYVRKAQYSFGWDWGPRIVQVGLWRGVYIRLVKHAEIKNPYFYTEKIEDDKAYVVISADIERYVRGDFEAEVELIEKDISIIKTRTKVEKDRIDLRIKVDNPKLWYPNGLGDQHLYEIKIRLFSGAEILDEKSFRSGIRTIRLIREKDEEGESFIFEINGVRVFAKGANWIPADNLLPRLSRKDYYEYIRLAKEANMNMLRIWGGGIYEDEAFYEACDEMGIMVWQDFMYACAEYPDQFEWFQKLAEEEAEKVILSLRNHPSIVLWCGNNENNWGFHSWWNKGDPKYLGNYIYKEILPKVCAKLDPSRPYWVSSPYGGEDPNSEAEGDRHQWNVWSGWVDYEEYRKDRGRFISEFGFQAMPDWRTVLSYTAPEERKILSPVMISHNKMVEGMERLVRFMVGRLGFPKDLKSFVYLTQFNQAEAIKTGVEHWRLRKFKTAGALYWQFDDCWPVASWSAVDYYKRKKALYYYSKRFYAEILPYVEEEVNGVTVYGISDLPYDKEVEVVVKVFKLNGEELAEKKLKARLIANDVTKIAHYSFEDLNIGYRVKEMPIAIPGCTLSVEKNGELLNSVVYVEIITDDTVYENYKVFGKFRDLDLAKPKIDYEVRENKIILRTDVPAFGVFIETEDDMELSDNCLNMMPDKKYEVSYSGKLKEIKIFDITQLIANI